MDDRIARWSPESLEDIDRIYEYIAYDSVRPNVAAAIYRAIIDECEATAKLIAGGHIIGTSRPDLGDGCRVVGYKRWVIVFRIVDDSIDILRIFDGSRDYPDLF